MDRQTDRRTDRPSYRGPEKPYFHNQEEGNTVPVPILCAKNDARGGLPFHGAKKMLKGCH